MTKQEQAYNEFSKEFNSYVETLRSRSADKYPEKLQELSTMRKIPVEVFEQAGVFYIENNTELVHPHYLEHLKAFGVISPTNNLPIYHERFIFPIRDMEGYAVGLVGYSREAHERYVYATSKYYSRVDDLYGLEAYSYALQEGYAILTEGITDTLAMRGLGYKNTFAMCGTRKSTYKNLLLDRLPYGVIKIPDNDAAGSRAAKGWEFRRSFVIQTPFGFKDTAEILEQPEWREHYKTCFPQIVSALKKAYDERHEYKNYVVKL